LPEIGSSHKNGDQFAGDVPMTVVEQGELFHQFMMVENECLKSDFRQNPMFNYKKI